MRYGAVGGTSILLPKGCVRGMYAYMYTVYMYSPNHSTQPQAHPQTQPHNPTPPCRYVTIDEWDRRRRATRLWPAEVYARLMRESEGEQADGYYARYLDCLSNAM